VQDERNVKSAGVLLIGLLARQPIEEIRRVAQAGIGRDASPPKTFSANCPATPALKPIGLQSPPAPDILLLDPFC